MGRKTLSAACRSFSKISSEITTRRMLGLRRSWTPSSGLRERSPHRTAEFRMRRSNATSRSRVPGAGVVFLRDFSANRAFRYASTSLRVSWAARRLPRCLRDMPRPADVGLPGIIVTLTDRLIRFPEFLHRLGGFALLARKEFAVKGLGFLFGCQHSGLLLGRDLLFSVANEPPVGKREPLIHPPPGFTSCSVLTDAHGFSPWADGRRRRQ